MNSRERMIAIVIAAAAVALACGAVGYALGDSTSHQQNDDSSGEITGYWYQIGYYSYKDGVYHDVSEGSDLPLAYGFAIHSCTDGVCEGSYLGCQLYAIYEERTLRFHGTFDDVTDEFVGRVSGDQMYAAVAETNDGVEEGLYLVFSRDPAATAKNLSNAPDIAGDWTMCSYLAQTSAGSIVLNGKALSLTQTGGAFCGTMENDSVDGTVSTDQVSGAFNGSTENGKFFGLLHNSGSLWYVLADGDQIVLLRAVNALGSYYVTERVYTRTAGITDDGAADSGLTGTTWYATDQTIGDVNRVWDEYQYVMLTITAQTGRLLSGTLFMSGYTYDCGGAIVSSDPTVIKLVGTNGSRTVSNTLIVSGDELLLTINRNNLESASPLGRVIHLSQTPGTVEDPTGHWYCSSTAGRTIDDTWTQSENLTDPDRSLLYDLTVLRVQDGLFWGIFHDTYVAGTFNNGFLAFTATIGDGSTVRFTASALTAHQLASVEIYVAADGTTEVWTSMYSDTPHAAAYDRQDLSALAGTWQLAKDGACTYSDGQRTALLGTELTLRTNSAFVYGTMEQEVAGALQVKDIIGLATNYTQGNNRQILIIDETGLVYHAEYTAGANGVPEALTLHGLNVTDTGTVGTVVAIERIYTRDGSTPAAADPPSFAGRSWTSTVSQGCTDRGVCAAYEPITVRVTAQDGTLLSGTVTVGDKDYAMVGYLMNIGEQPILMLSYNTGGQFFGGIMTLSDTGGAVLLGQTDPAGQPFAYRATLAADES